MDTSGQEQEVTRLQEELAAAKTALEEHTTLVAEKQTAIESVKKDFAEASAKSDTKFTKYKAQATAKTKRLEKQLEELQKVHV